MLEGTAIAGQPARRQLHRSGGLTILETVIACSLILVILGTLSAVFPVLIDETTNVGTALVAQMEGHKLRLSLLNDLQTTNPLGLDSLGTPYLQVANNTGTNDKLVFRRVEGYTADTANDIVTPVYGTPIEIYINTSGNLVRRQGGTETVVANRVSALQFSVSSRGQIAVAATTFAGRGAGYVQFATTLQVIPRNTQPG